MALVLIGMITNIKYRILDSRVEKAGKKLFFCQYKCVYLEFVNSKPLGKKHD